MAAKKKASTPKKRSSSQPARPASLAGGGRYTEGYGPYRQVGNPGAETYVRPTASDYIRPPLTMNKSKSNPSKKKRGK